MARARGHGVHLARLARLLWCAPCSLLGLVLGAVLLVAGGQMQRHGHVLEVAAARGGRRLALWRRLPFAAITMGHVVLGTDAHTLARLRAHERVHVAQYERLGVLMWLAYPLASLAALARGEDPYRGNRFEREAFEADRRA